MVNDISDKTRARVAAFKLSIELVPEPLWYKNLRSRLPQGYWDKIRKEVYKLAGLKCQICGHSGNVLYCHERWEYDDILHVQRLKGLEAICLWCHRVHRFGFSELEMNKSELWLLVRHFKRINDCCYQDLLLARVIASEVFNARSACEWSQDFGIYTDIINKVKSSYITNRTSEKPRYPCYAISMGV